MSQSHSGGIRLPSSLSCFLCYCREKWAVAGRGSGVDRAAPPARRGRCGAKRGPRPTRAGTGAGFGASGGCGLGSGRSGFLPRRRGAWASPGPRPRLRVSALAMAGPAPVRALRGPSSGRRRDRGLRVRRRGDPNKAGSARAALACATDGSGCPAFSPSRANAIGVWVSEGCSGVLRVHDVMI